MKKTFREYQKYNSEDFKKIWKECLFVFDTNTLLDMYRYKRDTAESYLKVLKKLKNENRLWIPYQVGKEFFENRIGVISELEKSYDDVIDSLDSAINELSKKYKTHPFLNFSEVKESLEKNTKLIIKNAKKNHPNWLKEDEVLGNLNEVFDGIVGKELTEEKLNEIREMGEKRYEKKIPPGFKDCKKKGDEKYGDLIVWLQIINKAKKMKTKKPIVFICNDVKEDWWLIRDGKKIMPLPKLKKEIYDEAGVDFHIYTSDNFLEFSKQDNKEIEEKIIKEVRKIREFEEEKIINKRRYLWRDISNSSNNSRVNILALLDLIRELRYLKLNFRFYKEVEELYKKGVFIRNKLVHSIGDNKKNIKDALALSSELDLILDNFLNSQSKNDDSFVLLLKSRIKIYKSKLSDIRLNLILSS